MSPEIHIKGKLRQQQQGSILSLNPQHIRRARSLSVYVNQCVEAAAVGGPDGGCLTALSGAPRSECVCVMRAVYEQIHVRAPQHCIFIFGMRASRGNTQPAAKSACVLYIFCFCC